MSFLGTTYELFYIVFLIFARKQIAMAGLKLPLCELPKSTHTTKAPISSIFCLKAICALLVVCIHFPPFDNNSIGIDSITRVAVPIFFMVSGFFLYSPDSNIARNRCKKTLYRTIKLLLTANLIYCLWHLFIIVWLYIKHPTLTTTFPVHDWASAIQLLFFGNVFSEHLWYLTAYIETLLVFLLILRTNKEIFFLFIIPLGLALSLLLGNYNIFEERLDTVWSRNFLTIGIPCVYIGWWMRKKQSLISQKVPKTMSWILLLLFAIVSYAEWWGLKKINPNALGDTYLFTIPFATAALLSALYYKNLGKSSYLESIGIKHSSNIYVYHILIGAVSIHFFNRVHPIREDFHTLLIFFCTLLASIVLTHFSKLTTSLCRIK